ncbi:MAG: hypothetical protein QF790_09335 [Gammaproteobacteria bacterium]|jgi:hypothetical protein|nr:hypothetical protein [Gammaproteobacteria bacterium]MDP6694927.1 hypothetical protein [Gammaproteobacteria bacterium]
MRKIIRSILLPLCISITLALPVACGEAVKPEAENNSATTVTAVPVSYAAPEATAPTDVQTSGLPVPELRRWEKQMVKYGKKWGPTLNPAESDAGKRQNNAYYDALYVYYRIMDYTGETEPWLTYAGWARHAWIEERYGRPEYNMVGYHRFSLGMLEDFRRGHPTADAEHPVPGNTPLTPDDFVRIRDLGSFAQPFYFVEEYCGSCSNISRELAYSIVATVVSERAGLPRVNHNDFGTGSEPRLQTYVRWAGRHLEQWRNASYEKRGYQPDESYHYMQPFMTGLTMKALIDFYEWEVENGRDPDAYWEDPTPDGSWPTIVEALGDFCNWLYSDATVRAGGGTPKMYVGERMWDEAFAGFRYADRYTPHEGETSDVVEAAPDLNLLIAPAYAWVWRQTGNARFRTQGDAIFAAGVRNGSPDRGGKQFNQQYFYGFDYVRWRSGE